MKQIELHTHWLTGMTEIQDEVDEIGEPNADIIPNEPLVNAPNRIREVRAGAYYSIFAYRSSPLVRDLRFRIGRNVVIKSVDSLYSTRLYYAVMSSHLACLICQYMLAFLQLPFEYFKNRPVICVINAIFGLLVV